MVILEDENAIPTGMLSETENVRTARK